MWQLRHKKQKHQRQLVLKPLSLQPQMIQTKVAVCQLLDSISEDNNPDSANEANPEVEHDTDVTEVAELAVILETIKEEKQWLKPALINTLLTLMQR